MNEIIERDTPAWEQAWDQLKNLKGDPGKWMLMGKDSRGLAFKNIATRNYVHLDGSKENHWWEMMEIRVEERGFEGGRKAYREGMLAADRGDVDGLLCEADPDYAAGAAFASANPQPTYS